MAANSNPVAIGSSAPDYTLPSASGTLHSLHGDAGEFGTLVAFICNHCPYVIHMRAALAQYARDYAGRGIGVVGINSNDPVAYPDDSPARMLEVEPLLGFPYLVDATQEVARAYDAACTPELYLYDARLRLYYHGRFDATRPGGGTPDGADLRAATDRLLAGQESPSPQAPALGCSIKWKR